MQIFIAGCFGPCATHSLLSYNHQGHLGILHVIFTVGPELTEFVRFSPSETLLIAMAEGKGGGEPCINSQNFSSWDFLSHVIALIMSYGLPPLRGSPSYYVFREWRLRVIW